MRPHSKYALSAMVPFALLVASVVWLRDIRPRLHSFRLPLGGFWGGNLDEVYSHWLDVAACTGVNTALLCLLVVERIVRHQEVGWIGSWTLRTGGILALAVWTALVCLDWRWGEGVVVASIIVFFLPLIVLSLVPFHLMASRLVDRSAYVLLAFVFAACMLGAQLVFEPSSTGSCNVLILPTIAAAALGLGLPASLMLWRMRITLLAKGYAWAGWKDAAFAALNLRGRMAIPSYEEVALLPVYREGDIKSLCRLARRSADLL